MANKRQCTVLGVKLAYTPAIVFFVTYRLLQVFQQFRKGQNPLHQFPRSKSATIPQHRRQVHNKLARAKVCRVCCVVSFPKFHYKLATSPSR